MKKAFSLFLVILTLLPILASCGDGQPSVPAADTSSSSAAETTAEVVETAKNGEVIIHPDLPDMDFGGAAFRLCVYENPTHESIRSFEFFAEAQDGEIVNDTIYERNMTIEERYNTVITQTGQSETDSTLTQSVMSGDAPFDLYVLIHQKAASVATKNVLADLYTLPYLDFDKPWWTQELGPALSIGGKLYLASSDYMLFDKKRTYCLFFNKEMCGDYGLGSPYENVFDGSWTLDRMRTMAEAVGSDLDGDGKMTIADRYGIVWSAYANTYGFLMGCGISAVTADDGGYSFTLYSDRLVSMLDKLCAITGNKSVSAACDDFSDWSANGTIFYGGNALFNSSIISGLQSASSNADFDYGALPMPKLDEAQDSYHTSSDREFSVIFGVPLNVADPDMTGLLFEALSAESRYTTRIAYIDTACKTKYAYDEDCARVLGIVFDNVYYNLGTFYNLGDMNAVLRDIVRSGSNTVASKYAALETKAQAALDELIDAFES